MFRPVSAIKPQNRNHDLGSHKGGEISLIVARA
jgi:hypothetical protein